MKSFLCNWCLLVFIVSDDIYVVIFIIVFLIEIKSVLYKFMLFLIL